MKQKLWSACGLSAMKNTKEGQAHLSQGERVREGLLEMVTPEISCKGKAGVIHARAGAASGRWVESTETRERWELEHYMIPWGGEFEWS